MPQHHVVPHVAAAREEWGWLVLLGDREAADASPYLMLQVAHEFSEDDRRLGQNQPHIEINTQRWSWYGHIERIELHRNELVVLMNHVAQDQMQNDGHFVFGFSLEESRFATLKHVLANVFASSEVYIASAA